jgi:hypothetical protein
MVDIQNIGEFACQVLNRDLWNESAVKEVIKAHFLFLQVSELVFLFYFIDLITFKIPIQLSTFFSSLIQKVLMDDNI